MAFGDRLTVTSRNLTTVGHVVVHDGKLAETVSRSPLSLANNAPSEDQRPQLTLPFHGFSGQGGIHSENKIDFQYQPLDTRSVKRKFAWWVIRGLVKLKGCSGHICATTWLRVGCYTSYGSYGCPLSYGVWWTYMLQEAAE